MSLIKRIEPKGHGISATHRLPDVADFYMQQLSQAEVTQLTSKFPAGKPLRVGTLCSGTDSPIPVIHTLGKVTGLKVEHVFSCEWAPKKQEWIRRNFPDLQYLFSDVKEVGSNEQAYDLLSKKMVAVPSVDLIIAGFVCKSVSTENNEREKYSACIDDATGQTGETFSGTREYMRRHRPGMVICENVAGLAKRNQGRDPQVFSVMSAFKDLGYAADWRLVDSRHFQLPQRRQRCWMWACLGGDDTEVKEQVPDTLTKLASTRHVKLEKLLAKNLGKASLLPRERKVIEVAKSKISKADFRRGNCIIDIAKSDHRAPVCIGATSCIVPNSKPYYVGFQRVLTPEEVLKVQGIYSEDFPALSKMLKEKGGPNLARDLAGNAFTSTVCMAVLIATLSNCTWVDKRARRSPARSASPATPKKRSARSQSPSSSSPKKRCAAALSPGRASPSTKRAKTA
mmetsp:Transcript_14282/g.33747  ORF Transcript_14282/g.33747 Transcript_14282/m.33747 type:complete len:454 (+) Transcript_14282:95-1456(+)|eukprot:CAMPEP_0178433480 /NCGR_PEP_ID=MMETSP0689_2-20121128/32925_1 /TAXON_ID=160604 /ORGANISM="Amphidinium massartii, Strain CS-259" /LENGTH=453 /DNA_ID=CAMNT_0020055505 /DNA_START=43 /DNA_END=1404 /DNA_ORIENTATION=+